MKTNDSHRAFSDINIFGTIIAILEGGVLCSPCSDAVAQKIIALCKAQNRGLVKALDAYPETKP